MKAWYSKVRDTELKDGSARATYAVTFETDSAELKREVEKYLQGIMDKTENNSEKPNNCEDEAQCDFGEYADRLWKIAYERGKREALEQTEPTISKMEQVDEPQTEPLHTCSVNGRPYSECSSCEHFKCTADEPQTERSE